MADQMTLTMDSPVIADELAEPETDQLPKFGIAAAQLGMILGLVEPAAQLPNVGQLVELSASKRGISVRTENIVMSLTAGLVQSPACVVAQAGSLVVGHDALTSLARRVDGMLTCVATPTGLDVTGAGIDVHVRRLPGNEMMPTAPTWPSSEISMTVDAAALSRAISRVSHAASPDRAGNNTSVLSGIAIESGEGSLRLSACDGFRLASAVTQTIEASWGVTEAVIVPERSMTVLAGLLGELLPGRVVTLRIDSRRTKLFCRADTWLWRSLLIDGTFPDLQQFLPKVDPVTSIDVARAQLIAAAKLAMAFQHQTTDKRRALALAVDKQGVTLSGADAERGRARRTVLAQVDGEPVTLALDGSFLTDALEAMGDQEVRLHLHGQTGLIVLREQIGHDVWGIVPMVMRGAGS